jgi:hypothetical protein
VINLQIPLTESFKTFLPYGYGTQRNNVLSPSTLSLERHRLLWLFLNEESDFFTSTVKESTALPLSKHFTNYSETKKIWIILQLIYSLLADVKQTSVICPLKTI